MTDNQLSGLRNLFSDRNDVAFAYLFGSAVTGRQMAESDVDIAVYFVPKDTEGLMDLEEPDARFDAECDLWSACENICHKNVDLVVLNRSPATVAAAALLTGVELAVSRGGLYRAFFNAVTSLAEEFRAFTEEFIQISRRSMSLSPVDRDRLVRIMQYVRFELGDAHLYDNPDAARYSTDGHYRRGMERWIENLVNASIDIAKIVLGAEQSAVPQTYRGQMDQLGLIRGFDAVSKKLAHNTRIRNAPAHEYLDLRYAEVKTAVESAPTVYADLIDLAEKWMESSDVADT